MPHEASRRRFGLRVAFSIPKARDYPNEDNYQCSDRLGIYALSDGASISYDSVSWSQILVRRYATQPDVDSKWLGDRIAEFSKLHDRESLPWMKQAAFDRGSFASLLGVRLSAERTSLQILAVGDSLAVLCEGDRLVATWPYVTADEFEQSPQLLSTNPSENVFLEDATCPAKFITAWGLVSQTDPAVLCMTDALGQWVLKYRDEAISCVSILRSIRTRKDFAKFVDGERAAGRLRRDDTTLLGLW